MQTNAHAENFLWARSHLVILAFVFLGTALFVGLPAFQLVAVGPFSWHIKQPQVWQGGLEAVVLTAMIGAGFAINRKLALIIMVFVPGILYLRRHAADVSLLIDLAYFEILVGLGMGALRYVSPSAMRCRISYLHAFAVGFVVWSLCAWTLAAFAVGSITNLRWLTVLLILPACGGRAAPLCVHAWRSVRKEGRAGRIWCGILGAWVLILFARSKTVVGYDSIWYGLRGEYVLDPGDSFFESLNLVSPVYYFPKLYEVFLLPLSALNDFSVIEGMTILLLVPILITCRSILRRVAVPSSNHWPLLALVATLPAFANNLLGSKPDIIATLFVLLSALSAIELISTRSLSKVWWMLVFSVLACMAKLVSIPYIALLTSATIAALLVWRRTSITRDPLDEGRAPLLVLAATMILAGLVTARTWWLTGVPTVGPEPFVHFWHITGFSFKEPAGSIRWMFPIQWSTFPGLVFDVLFRPQHKLPHMVISWIGNVWLWMGLVALMAAFLLRPVRGGILKAGPSLISDGAHGTPARLPSRDASNAHLEYVGSKKLTRLPLLALVGAGLYCYFCIGYADRGSDGNYFLYAVIPAILIAGASAVHRLEHNMLLNRAMAACLACFVFFHAAYSFVSASWIPGTRTFDTDLRRTWHGAAPLRARALEAAGLTRIGEYLSEHAVVNSHVVGTTIETSGHWLPVRYESSEQIGYARPEYLTDSASFRQFLARFDIRYLIVPTAAEETKGNPNTASTPLGVIEALEQLQRISGVRRIDDRRHVLFDLSALALGEISSASPND